MPQNATKSHKKPQNATKSHKKPQNATIFLWPGSSGKKRSFFVKSFGRDRLIVSNGKTGKCHFVAVERTALSFLAGDHIFYGLWAIKVLEGIHTSRLIHHAHRLSLPYLPLAHRSPLTPFD
jgi:hypothetical protein